MKKEYNFITTFSMVVGVIVGSGIFFKADDVLKATNGSILIGVIGFLIVGFGVLFGVQVISKYAKKTNATGGMIQYAQMALGRRFAFCVGFFLVTIYFPALIVVLSMVTASYFMQLFGITNANLVFILSILIMLSTIFNNIKSIKLGGLVQNVTTVITFIPLILIGIFGLFSASTTEIQPAVSTSGHVNFLTMLIAIAFSFDGWIVATSISGEIKNSKRMLPRALISGILFTIIIYVTYFVGISLLISPEQIIALQDQHTMVAAQIVFGNMGGKLITLFVVIAMYGGLNGAILAYLRMPDALVEANLVNSKFMVKVEQNQTVISKSGLRFISLTLTIFIIIQLLISKKIIFGNLPVAFDLSSLPITVNYIFYIVLYLLVFRVTKERSITLIISVFLAIASAIIVLIGALQANGILYIFISFIVILFGQIYYQSEKKESI